MLLRPLPRPLVDPRHVLLPVGVELLPLPPLSPQDEVGVLDAVGGAAGGLGERAEREARLRGEEPQSALEAGGDAGEDDAGVAGEALGAAVDEGLDGGQVGVAVVVKLFCGIECECSVC